MILFLSTWRAMKRASKVIVVILLVFTALKVGGNIFPIGTDADIYEVRADLNVRTGAGTNYTVIFTLKRGEEVAILSKDGNWYQIRYAGKSGYVNSKYLAYSRTEAAVGLSDDQPSMANVYRGLLSIAIIIAGFYIFRIVRDYKLLNSVTKLNRGTKTERDLVLHLLKNGIPAQTIFHDLYLTKYNGEYSQIDLVVITSAGIIVMEVKSLSGWIFGNGNYSGWTQVLAFGKTRYRFYNPIMQNNRHIQELKRKIIHSESIPFFSMVVFYGDCVLKELNFIPKGTFLVKANRVMEVINKIRKENVTVDYADKEEIVRVLKLAVQNGQREGIQERHIKNIEDKLGKKRIFD